MSVALEKLNELVADVRGGRARGFFGSLKSWLKGSTAYLEREIIELHSVLQLDQLYREHHRAELEHERYLESLEHARERDRISLETEQLNLDRATIEAEHYRITAEADAQLHSDASQVGMTPAHFSELNFHRAKMRTEWEDYERRERLKWTIEKERMEFDFEMTLREQIYPMLVMERAVKLLIEFQDLRQFVRGNSKLPISVVKDRLGVYNNAIGRIETQIAGLLQAEDRQDLGPGTSQTNSRAGSREIVAADEE